MHQRSHLKPQIKLMNDKKYSYYSIQLNVPKVVLKRLINPLSSALINSSFKYVLQFRPLII